MDPALIALIVIVALIVAIMVAWPLLLRRFIRRYYDEKYQPVDLSPINVQGLPEEMHLQTVPWFTDEHQLCQSTSLQMIAAKNGMDYPRPFHDFLMGFTYGASRLPTTGFSPLGSDPELGFLTAAPYLGLARKYSISDDPSVFAATLRTTLAQDEPVRLALDMATLYGRTGFIAHSVVLVGYDTRGFYYYETVASPPSTTSAGNRPPGETGLFVSEEVLLRAVERMSSELKYPWRYALTVFEPAETEEDLRPIWTRNGSALIEDNKYGPRMGARVVEELADELIRDGKKFNVETIRPGVALAVIVRKDNTEFLRRVFANDMDVMDAAEHLEQAAKNYRMALEDLEDGIADQIEARRIATCLREAAGFERKAGAIFLTRGLPETETKADIP